MVVVHSATKGFAAMTSRPLRTREGGWITSNPRAYWPEFVATGQGAGITAWLHSCSRTRPASLRSTRAGRSLHSRQTSIDSPWCWRARSQSGRRAPARAITPSASGSTKASCCGESIPGIAASDSSSRTRSRRPSGPISTSGFLKAFQTRSSPRSPLGRGRLRMLFGFPLALSAGRDESQVEHVPLVDRESRFYCVSL